MYRKLIGLLLIFFLIFGSGCKLIYHNRTPVVQAKNRYNWYHGKKKRQKRLKIVWMKTHKGKFKETKKTSPSTPMVPEGPDSN